MERLTGEIPGGTGHDFTDAVALHLRMVRLESRIGASNDGCYDPVAEPTPGVSSEGSGHVTYRKTDRGWVAEFVDGEVGKL